MGPGAVHMHYIQDITYFKVTPDADFWLLPQIFSRVLAAKHGKS